MDDLPSKEEILARSNSRARIGRTSGIYFLILGEEIVYIGQSLNVYARIRDQNNPGRNMNFDKFSYILCNANNLNELEKEFIHKFNPIYNVQRYRLHPRSRYPDINLEDLEL